MKRGYLTIGMAALVGGLLTTWAAGSATESFGN